VHSFGRCFSRIAHDALVDVLLVIDRDP